MKFDFEKEVSRFRKGYTNPYLRDPYKDKLRDHRNRGKCRFENRKSSNYSSFRKQNNDFCQKLLILPIEEMGSIAEPIYK